MLDAVRFQKNSSCKDRSNFIERRELEYSKPKAVVLLGALDTRLLYLSRTTICQGSAQHEETLDCELGEEMLSGEAKVADLWSVCTAEEAVGRYG